MEIDSDFIDALTIGAEVPRNAIVQLYVDIPQMIVLNAKHPNAPKTTSIECPLDGASRFFLETVYKMIWTTIDNFGAEDSDPRLAPLLDLLEVIQTIEGRC